MFPHEANNLIRINIVNEQNRKKVDLPKNSVYGIIFECESVEIEILTNSVSLSVITWIIPISICSKNALYVSSSSSLKFNTFSDSYLYDLCLFSPSLNKNSTIEYGFTDDSSMVMLYTTDHIIKHVDKCKDGAICSNQLTKPYFLKYFSKNGADSMLFGRLDSRKEKIYTNCIASPFFYIGSKDQSNTEMQSLRNDLKCGSSMFNVNWAEIWDRSPVLFIIQLVILIIIPIIGIGSVVVFFLRRFLNKRREEIKQGVNDNSLSLMVEGDDFQNLDVDESFENDDLRPM